MQLNYLFYPKIAFLFIRRHRKSDRGSNFKKSTKKKKKTPQKLSKKEEEKRRSITNTNILSFKLQNAVQTHGLQQFATSSKLTSDFLTTPNQKNKQTNKHKRTTRTNNVSMFIQTQIQFTLTHKHRPALDYMEKPSTMIYLALDLEINLVGLSLITNGGFLLFRRHFRNLLSRTTTRVSSFYSLSLSLKRRGTKVTKR